MGLKELKEEYPILGNANAAPQLLGITALCPYIANTSSPRLSMVSTYLTQNQTMPGATPPLTFTGFEDNYGNEFCFNSTKRPYDIEVLDVISKYRDIRGKSGTIAATPTKLVIYRALDPKDGKIKIGCFSIDRYFRGTDGFGWEYNMVNESRVRPGEYIPKEMVIAQSPAFKGRHYSQTVDLNTCYVTAPETLEDSIVISKSAAAKMTAWEVHEIVLNIRQSDRPTNIHGDELEPKFIPDIGDEVGDEGVFCSFRGASTTTCAAATDPEALRVVQNMNDTVFYITPNARIADIDVIMQKGKSTQMYKQLDRYVQNLQNYYQRIVDVFAQIKKNNPNITLTDKFNETVTDAMRRLIAMGVKLPSGLGNGIRPEIIGVTNKPVEFIQLIVTYVAPSYVMEGSKLADRNGSKGLVSEVRDDEDMPIDDFGFRVEQMILASSPISRMNLGQLYEPDNNRVAEFVRRRVAEEAKVDPLKAFETLYEFYHDVNPASAVETKKAFTTDRMKIRHVKNAIANGVRLHILPYLDTIGYEHTEWLAAKWGCQISPVEFNVVDAFGVKQRVRTVEPVSIGPKATFHLCKRPYVTSGGVTTVSHHGLPAKTSGIAKHTSPINTNPVKIIGEDEGRVAASGCPGSSLMRLMCLQANSLRGGVDRLVKTLLTSKHPTAIKRIDVSDEELKLTNASTAIYHYTTSLLGIETRQTRAHFMPPENLQYSAELLQADKSSMSDIDDDASDD